MFYIVCLVYILEYETICIDCGLMPGAFTCHHCKEWVAVLIELYEKNVTVSRVVSDLLSDLALSTANSQMTYITEPRVVVTILEYHVRSD